MLARGVECYHIEPLEINVSIKEAASFRVYNEFYYLRDTTTNITVTSDHSYYNYAQPSESNFYEFTGEIKITNNDSQIALVRVQLFRVIIK